MSGTMADYVTQQDLDLTISNLLSLIEAMRKEIIELIQAAGQVIENNEQQMAMLTLALGEQAVLADAMLATVVHGTPLEDTFVKEVRKSREHLRNTLEGNDGPHTAEGYSDATPSMEPVDYAVQDTPNTE